MRTTISAALFGLSAITASAIECPDGSSSDALLATRWEYTGSRSVMVVVQNTIAKEIRMVDAEIYFVDALGRMVGDGPLSVDPDLGMFPSKTNSFRVPAPPGYERLGLGGPGDFEATMCTEAILFSDGTKQVFTAD